jgi:hypothetical protein
MPLDYASVKHLLTPEQRLEIEGAKGKRRAQKPKVAPAEQVKLASHFRSDLDSAWRICENKCMSSMNGIETCDVCEGPMRSLGTQEKTP